MTSPPRVTVICLCYNQERFVREAIFSVLNQTHPDIQLLVVDDASTDNSARVIKDCIASHPDIRFFPLSRNVGNCRAFNHALAHAGGDFIIDLAADDVLLPDRVTQGILALDGTDGSYGVHFTDAEWISEEGHLLYRHSDRFPHHTIPQGDIYRDLITRFFICSPSMMFRREVIASLGGYDETLRYEDFDFWIRSSRTFRYRYTPEVLVRKRVVRNSMSKRQFSLLSSQLESTFRVCEKIMLLNRSAAEQRALQKRIVYEMRVCLRLLHLPLFLKYAHLFMQNRRMKYG